MFYIGNNDWSLYQNDELWNSGTKPDSKKTDYDPCPIGWRVPTRMELYVLIHNYSKWTSDNVQNGYWFSGDYTYLNDAPQIFFPAAGYRDCNEGKTNKRDKYGCYWCMEPFESGSKYALCLKFGDEWIGDYNGHSKANGYSVRCVQE